MPPKPRKKPSKNKPKNEDEAPEGTVDGSILSPTVPSQPMTMELKWTQVQNERRNQVVEERRRERDQMLLWMYGIWAVDGLQ